TKDAGGRKVANGGENNVVAWAVNPATGEPTLIQRAWTDNYELRTFAMDPSGQVLIAASTTPMQVLEQDVLSTVSAGLSVYKCGCRVRAISATCRQFMPPGRPTSVIRRSSFTPDSRSFRADGPS